MRATEFDSVSATDSSLIATRTARSMEPLLSMQSSTVRGSGVAAPDTTTVGTEGDVGLNMYARFQRKAAVGHQRRAVMPRPTAVQKATTTTMPLMKMASTGQSTSSRRWLWRCCLGLDAGSAAAIPSRRAELDQWP